MPDLDFLKYPEIGGQSRDLRKAQYYSGEQNFWNLNNHDIPTRPGAYVLLARGTRFQYPIGKNPVYYIGQSTNLKQRLVRHLRYAKQARDNRQRLLYRPRIEYAANFGTHYCYIRTWQGLGSKSLEDVLMAYFAEKHRSFPIANGAGSWARVAKIFAD